MFPKWHILIGSVFAYILVTFFNFSLIAGIVIFLSSILIDLDHYFLYIIQQKKFSPSKFWEYSIDLDNKINKLSTREKAKYKLPIFAFHGIEFWSMIILLSFINPVFYWIILGIIIHMIPDFIELIYAKDPLYLKLSIIIVYITNKKKKTLS